MHSLYTALLLARLISLLRKNIASHFVHFFSGAVMTKAASQSTRLCIDENISRA